MTTPTPEQFVALAQWRRLSANNEVCSLPLAVSHIDEEVVRPRLRRRSSILAVGLASTITLVACGPSRNPSPNPGPNPGPNSTNSYAQGFDGDDCLTDYLVSSSQTVEALAETDLCRSVDQQVTQENGYTTYDYFLNGNSATDTIMIAGASPDGYYYYQYPTEGIWYRTAQRGSGSEEVLVNYGGGSTSYQPYIQFVEENPTSLDATDFENYAQGYAVVAQATAKLEPYNALLDHYATEVANEMLNNIKYAYALRDLLVQNYNQAVDQQRTGISPTTSSSNQAAIDNEYVYVGEVNEQLNANLQREDTCPSDSGDDSVMDGCGYNPIADDPVNAPS
jgi:hypothetical protein